MENLQAKAKPEQLNGMARYGMTIKKRLGVSIPDIRKIAKKTGKNHSIAVSLWETGILEARILAAMVADPKKLTEGQMEKWVRDINSWDVCDEVCMNLFRKTPYAWKKIIDWSRRDEEFVKRAAFSLLACLAVHDKEADNDMFINLFPVIIHESTDDRNLVKKAISWALRNVGKRNLFLNNEALKVAREIQRIDAKSARWIASRVIRELKSETVQRKLKK
jgi:3-methyladenine DNA glycosylase AlkD